MDGFPLCRWDRKVMRRGCRPIDRLLLAVPLVDWGGKGHHNGLQHAMATRNEYIVKHEESFAIVQGRW